LTIDKEVAGNELSMYLEILMKSVFSFSPHSQTVLANVLLEKLLFAKKLFFCFVTFLIENNHMKVLNCYPERIDIEIITKESTNLEKTDSSRGTMAGTSM
jgi:hypothetical protein